MHSFTSFVCANLYQNLANSKRIDVVEDVRLPPRPGCILGSPSCKLQSLHKVSSVEKTFDHLPYVNTQEKRKVSYKTV